MFDIFYLENKCFLIKAEPPLDASNAPSVFAYTTE